MKSRKKDNNAEEMRKFQRDCPNDFRNVSSIAAQLMSDVLEISSIANFRNSFRMSLAAR